MVTIAPGTTPSPDTGPRVGLFVTCLADLFRPSVGFATVRLLENAGCSVEAPEAVACCGQPAWNSGDRADARDIAAMVIEAYRGFDYLVAPSGSCVGMIRAYPTLFDRRESLHAEALELSGRAFEISAFLVDVLGVTRVQASFQGAVTYHDSCTGLRELGIKQQPRTLLESVDGLQLREMVDAEVCCGFGGTFCVKYPQISTRMVSNKTANVDGSDATMLLAGDLGCLLNIAGRLKRQGSPVQVRHLVEVLAGMTDQPPLGEVG